MAPATWIDIKIVWDFGTSDLRLMFRAFAGRDGGVSHAAEQGMIQQLEADTVRVADAEDTAILREVADTLRDALVPDRIAEAMAHRLQRPVSDGIRGVLRDRLARELRDVLRDAATRGGDGTRAAALLNVRLSDAVENHVRDALIVGSQSVLRNRFPEAFRSAVCDTAFVRRYGPTAVDELSERVQSTVDKAIRQRLRDGLRRVVRTRVADVARERLTAAFRAASEDGAGESDDRAATLGESIEEVLHDRLLAGILDRFRCIVTNSVHEAAGERIGDALAPASSATMAHRSPPPRLERRATAGTLARFAQNVERPLADGIRAHLTDGVAERIAATLHETVDAVVHDRLAGAIRIAIAQQLDAATIDVDRLADAIHYELAEVVQARLCDGVRAAATDMVRRRLREAIRAGISSTPVG